MEVFELSYIGTPAGLMKYIGEAICEYCLGVGYVVVAGSVYAGEPHQAFVDDRICVCQLKEE